MIFSKINKSGWNRKEYFDHYYSEVPCTYSMTTKLDITAIIKKNYRLYPTMLYYLGTIVNRHPEFRTGFNKDGELGIYSELIPSYTVFHKDTETFSELWTQYSENYEEFCAAYEDDMEKYGENKGLVGKPNVPDNIFTVSAVPWTVFDGFNLNLQRGYNYLIPVFTMGRYYHEDGKFLLPLAIQVHHAVCDGFHVARFINELQSLIND